MYPNLSEASDWGLFTNLMRRNCGPAANSDSGSRGQNRSGGKMILKQRNYVIQMSNFACHIADIWEHSLIRSRSLRDAAKPWEHNFNINIIQKLLNNYINIIII